MSNKKLKTHHSLYYKEELPDMYVPVPLRTAITFRLFWWNKLSIKIRTVFNVVKTKFKKPKHAKGKANEK